MLPRLPLPLLSFLVAALALLVAPATSGAAPGAQLGAVDCDAGGAIATLTNSEGGPARFTILRDDVAISTDVVPAGGAPVTRIVPIAEGRAARITVRYGSSYVSSYVRRDCSVGGAASIASVDSSSSAPSAPYDAQLVVPGTGVRGADQAAASAATPGASAAAGGDVTINDRVTTWPLLVAALVILSMLALLVRSARLRTRIRVLVGRPAPAARQRA